MSSTYTDEELFSKELLAIYKVSQAIVRHKNVSALLNEVLDILDTDFGATRATLTLYHEQDNSLIIEASKGLSAAEKGRGRYSLGEGITGEVGLKKEAVVIEDVSKESRFLDRTKARKDSSHAFICVPILRDGKLIGTISIDLPKLNKTDLVKSSQLLRIISNLLADAVATIRQSIHEKNSLKEENSRLLKELGNKFKPTNIIGNSGNMQKVYEKIALCCDNPAPILIRGESGTGKELVAKAVHYSGIRQNTPFVVVEAATIPAPLLEGALFGKLKKNELRTGYFDQAHGGTLFIDEIAALPLQIQSKIVRYLHNQEIERADCDVKATVNVRLIVASSRNLEELLEDDEFSEELYYKLNVLPIVIPPLRDRKSDITLLADFFLDEFNKSYNKNVSRISTPAINMMMAYHYPGNVRELKNCIERAVLSSSDEVIHGYNLPPSLQTQTQNDSSTPDMSSVNDLAAAVNTYERELIVEALKRHRGNAAAAARALSTTPRVLNYKFNKLKINLKEFKKYGGQ
ncbi:MAG: sigma 54-interacting transcriptional regulator [Lentisphaeraceae bacterium]|nr:sigma 54-interacting transcriptional regulator [Lentisphaeraceae bacterium]